MGCVHHQTFGVVENVREPILLLEGAWRRRNCRWDSFAAAYTVGKDTGEKEIEVYKTANKIDFSTLAKQTIDSTAALRKAIDEFRTMLVDNKSYEELKSHVAKLNDYNKALSIDRDNIAKKEVEIENKYKILTTDFSKLTSPEEPLTIKKGTSMLVGGTMLNIGFLGTYGDQAELNVNGRRNTVKAGDVISSDNYFSLSKDIEDKFLCTIRVIEAESDNPIKLRVQCIHN